MPRIQSLREFWPYYLSEHRNPTSRKLHFVGTSWFFATVAGSFVLSPVFFPPAFLGMVGIGAVAARMESKKAAVVPLLAMVGLTTAASPVLIPAGVIGAYGMAWAGHFKVEHNRPATFQYPVWSFLCDFRMWGNMVRGKLWKGDPLDELGLSWEEVENEAASA